MLWKMYRWPVIHCSPPAKPIFRKYPPPASGCHWLRRDHVAPDVERPDRIRRVADHHHALGDVVVPDAHVAAAAFHLQAVVPTVAHEVAVDVRVRSRRATVTTIPSWNDCSAKQTLLAFVARVTEPGSQDFVPQPERIAVFDNDGTLWPENPVPFQFAFALAELERRVVDEPQLKADPMVQAALAGDLAKLLEGPRHDGLLRILALTHAGMTTDQFQDRVDSRQYRFERRGAVFFGDRIKGVVLLQAGDQSLHHPAELIGAGKWRGSFDSKGSSARL